MIDEKKSVEALLVPVVAMPLPIDKHLRQVGCPRWVAISSPCLMSDRPWRWRHDGMALPLVLYTRAEEGITRLQYRRDRSCYCRDRNGFRIRMLARHKCLRHQLYYLASQVDRDKYLYYADGSRRLQELVIVCFSSILFR